MTGGSSESRGSDELSSSFMSVSVAQGNSGGAGSRCQWQPAAAAARRCPPCIPAARRLHFAAFGPNLSTAAVSGSARAQGPSRHWQEGPGPSDSASASRLPLQWPASWRRPRTRLPLSEPPFAPAHCGTPRAAPAAGRTRRAPSVLHPPTEPPCLQWRSKLEGLVCTLVVTVATSAASPGPAMLLQCPNLSGVRGPDANVQQLQLQ